MREITMVDTRLREKGWEERIKRGRGKESAAGGCDLPPRIRLKIKRYAPALVSAKSVRAKSQSSLGDRVEEVLATGPVRQRSTSDEEEEIERRVTDTMDSSASGYRDRYGIQV
ncbi:hypothetical protein K0M31_014924 [Melipona bicolor]|uniref:Uncharacterized protein n=1 Tax=Melipona bicolor TaxID=60889 RepID=A0AA40FGJ2_9HYME|nr:hypothetical protein K0M31_014924 [Melipona bicolor]